MKACKFYCVRCKDKVSVSPSKTKHTITRNGRNALKSSCPYCKCKLYAFISDRSSRSRKSSRKSVKKSKRKSVKKSKRKSVKKSKRKSRR